MFLECTKAVDSALLLECFIPHITHQVILIRYTQAVFAVKRYSTKIKRFVFFLSVVSLRENVFHCVD